MTLLAQFSYKGAILTLVGLLLLITSGRCECPSSCFCHRRKVVCNGPSITKVPPALPTHIQELLMQGNNIEELPSDAFAKYPKLESLTIRKTKLSIIHPHAFRGLPMLKELSVTDNPHLRKLFSHSFGDLNSARMGKQIDLRRNGFKEIDKFAFENSRHIRMLDLRQNPVKVLRKNAFTGLYNVVFMHLPESIRKIEPDAFYSLIRVHYLEIVHWRTAFTEPYTFNGMRQVKTISIHHSHLGTITPETFGGMETVEFLFIFNSEIEHISASSFASIHNIRLIAFKWCHISQMDRNLSHLTRHKLLLLQDNHIDCTCGNVWLLANNTGATEATQSTNFCRKGQWNGKTLLSVQKQFWNQCFPNRVERNLPEEWTSSANYRFSIANVLIILTAIMYLLIVNQ